jgi:cation diffusion facilitator family transporter
MATDLRARDAALRESGWLKPMACTAVGMIGNVLLTAAKLAVGFMSGSASLVADGFHSFSDLASDVGVLIALRVSEQPPDRNHPYGHHQYETLGALAAALLLLATGVLLGRDAVVRMIEGHSLVPEYTALITAAVSFLLKEVMARYTELAGRIHHSPALRTNAAHHRSDSLSSLAALAGIGGAMVGWPVMDSLGELLISVWILRMGWRLLRENTDILMETRPSDEVFEQIRDVAQGVPGVRRVRSVRVRPRGSVYLVDLAIMVPPALSVSEGHETAHAVEDALRREIDQVIGAVVHVEPDE